MKKDFLLKFVRIIVFLLWVPVFAFGQKLENYRPLESQKPIPQEFLTSSSRKYEEAKEHLEIEEAEKKTRESKQDFLLESNFLIDQVLSSGRVLFNDPVSQYLNQIMDLILTDDPDLRKQIRVYAVRSSVVNSFTTDDGKILVNLGLLAQLENEAQLAFILCHELVHFTEKHIINAYVENQEIKQGKGEYRRSSFDEKMLAKSRYSKELEKDADRLGLDRFLKTPYSAATLLNVFEVLRYAHLPFDDIPFDKKFFNAGYYQIDESYFLNRVIPVEILESDGSSHGTHPDPTERQELARLYLSKLDASLSHDYLVSESQFKELREISRFELSDLYLKANEPIKSIYNSFLLLKNHPDNDYLKKNLAYAIYTLSKFKNGGNYGYVHPGFSHIEGESQQLYHLFYRLKPGELSVLATGYLWRLKECFPNDVDIDAMAKDLLTDLMLKYHTPGMLADSQPPEGWNKPDTTRAIIGKYDRLKQKSKENPRLTMVKYALTDLFANPEFDSLFAELEHEKWGGSEDEFSSQENRKQNKSDIKYWKNHGFNLGAKKVVVVTPVYSKLDLRKKQQHKFVRSESAKHKLINQIKRSSKLLNLETEILDVSLLDSSQVERFNDIAFLNEWIDQRFLQLDATMVNLNQERIDSIVKKYDTELFTWTGVINYRENKPLLYFYLLYALIPPAIPYAIYYMARANFDTYYYCITFNLKTGDPVMVNYNNFNKRDTKDMINSNVYDSFWQMKRQSKKKK